MSNPLDFCKIPFNKPTWMKFHLAHANGNLYKKIHFLSETKIVLFFAILKLVTMRWNITYET